MEVHLLGRVVGMNISPLSPELIHRVLHRVDPARHRMLRHPDRVAQSPAQQGAVHEIIGVAVLLEVADVEGADLGVAGALDGCFLVDVAVASSGDDKHVWLLLGEEQCS